MAEDTLSRYHIPDETARIRGSSEAGMKFSWEKIFHPEETDPHGPPHIDERIPGGGLGAIDQLFENPDYVDPELLILFSEFTNDVYGIDGKEPIYEAAQNELLTINKHINNTPSDTSEAKKSKLEEITTRYQIIDFMIQAGYERQIGNNFAKWLESDDSSSVEYDFRHLPKAILESIEANKFRGLEPLELTSNLNKIKGKNTKEREKQKQEMTTWLNAWTDPDSGLQEVGVVINERHLEGIALNTTKYGVVGVDFITWIKALGGEYYKSRVNGTQVAGGQFDKNHIIKPGNGHLYTERVFQSLMINGISHPKIPVSTFRR